MADKGIMAENNPPEEHLEGAIELPTPAPEPRESAKEPLPRDKSEIKNTALPAKLQTALAKTESPESAYHTLKFIEDVPLRMVAEVARVALPLRDILSWQTGSVVKFNKIIGEPIEVLIGEQLLARGEIVVINNRFGIRISEITHPDEKIGEARP